MGEDENGKGGSVDVSHGEESRDQAKTRNEDSHEETMDNSKRDSSLVQGSNDDAEYMQKGDFTESKRNDSKKESSNSKLNEFKNGSMQDQSQSKRDNSYARDACDRGTREFSGDESSPDRKRDRSHSRGSDAKRKRVNESRERRSESKDHKSRDRERKTDSSRDKRRRYNSRDRSKDNSRRRSRSRRRRSRSRSRRSRSRGSNRPAKLFIGNLSFDTDVDTLDRIFSKYGRLADVYIPRPNQREETRGRPSPRSKGYAFVTYEHPEDAADALRDWDQRELDGRKIAVEYSKPRRTQRYRSRSRGYSRNYSRGYRRGRSRSRSY